MAPCTSRLPALLALACAACTSAPGGGSNPTGTANGTPSGCVASADCDDGDACTADTCNGICFHAATPGCVAPCDQAHPCVAGICDPASRTCVACLADANCPTGKACQDGACAPAPACATDLDCKVVNGVCALSAGVCVDCLSDADCAAGNRCEERRCVPRPPCASSKDCTKVCDKAATICVDCAADSDCGAAAYCDSLHRCQAAVCITGACAQGAHFACKADGSGYVAGSSCNDGDDCTTDACTAGGCTYKATPADCDDANACTTGDACGSDGCVGEAVDCDDANPCTTDACAPLNGCKHSPNGFSCNDGDSCTTNDTCKAGACGGSLIPCDDGDACTIDSCATGAGCAHEKATGAPCNDGDACSSDDDCVGGKCTGTIVSCDDGNLCTTNVCNAKSGCAHVPAAGPCDDGLACTTADHCDNGNCQAAPKICDDGIACTTDGCSEGVGCTHKADDGACGDQNGCTDDACDTSKGCVQTAIVAMCDDGDACTAGELCQTGVCGGGKEVICDDGNECTDDSCVPAKGCVHASNVAGCEDGNPCTHGDTCVGGVCAGYLAAWQQIESSAYLVYSVVGLTAVSGGFVVVGNARVNAGADLDAWLLRTNASGSKLWEKKFAKPWLQQPHSVVELPDGLAIAGTDYEGGGGFRGWMLRTNPAGEMLWQESYGPSKGQSEALGLVALTDGFAFAGFTPSPDPKNGSDFWLVRTDAAGKALWQRTFGGSGKDEATALDEAQNGLVVAGRTNSKGAGLDDIWLVRTDGAGNKLWDQTYGGAGTDRAIGVISVADGYAIAGFTTSKGAGGLDYWLIRSDSSGKVLWDHTFGTIQSEQPLSLSALPDGYLLGGSLVVRTDSQGVLVWSSTITQTFPNIAGAVAVVDGFAHAGRTWDDKAWIVRTDLFGNETCASSGPCAAFKDSACSDANPCTTDSCDAAHGGCWHAPLPGGTPCGAGKLCAVGVCK